MGCWPMMHFICWLNFTITSSNEKEKAKSSTGDMLTRHPGSVFTEESREKFRELREIFPDVLNNPEGGVNHPGYCPR
jgi:hypothetical protein